MVTRSPGLAAAELSARQVRLVQRALGRDRNRQEAVHRARKAIRRLRSLLALGSETFGPSLEPIDKRLKRLAQSLSVLRDAHVAAETALVLAEDGDADAWRQLACTLERRCDALLAQALIKDPTFSIRRSRVRKIAEQIAALPWHQLSRHDLQGALLRSARRARKAAATANSTRSPGDMHRWRRRVRHLRFQLEALGKIPGCEDVHFDGPHGAKKATARTLGKLTDKLGWCQDLQVLKSASRGIADPVLMSRLKQRMERELKLLKR